MSKAVNRLIIIILSILYSSCKSVDLSSNISLLDTTSESDKKGRSLLKESKIAMGYEKFLDNEVYETDVIFDWNPFWSLVTKNPFTASDEKRLNFKLATNSFDSQLTYLEGNRAGTILGTQSTEGYIAELNSSYLKKNRSKRMIWGLISHHLLLEIPLHFEDAERVKYLGKIKLEGADYELVYIYFETDFNKNNGIGLFAYLNEKTKFLDILKVSVNEPLIKVPNRLRHVSARFERNKTATGIYLPNEIIIQYKKPKSLDCYVYKITLFNYQFDSFDLNQLQRIKGSE